uniref:F-box domain-containing protein n=1 Tax=Tetradesmus obliquus TaxID=3088 RepID=A0A383VDH4_TETOB|eukprot:jgi/Sobl393_1/12724/SZX63608.1
MLQNDPFDDEGLGLGCCNTYGSLHNTYGGRFNTYDSSHNTYGRRFNTYGSPHNAYGGHFNTYGSPHDIYSGHYSTYCSPYNSLLSRYDNCGGPYSTYSKACRTYGSYYDRCWPHGPPWQGQMPADLLPHILQYVDCRKRMNTMALVSRAWRTAADAAAVTNEDVHLLLDNNQGTITASLAGWLRKHGSGVRSIDLNYKNERSDYYYHNHDLYNGDINPNLPFSQLAGLRSLSLVNANPQKDGAGLRVMLHCHTPEHPSFQRQLGCLGSSLTSLTLQSVQLSDISSGWHFVAALTSLQHLGLQQAPLSVCKSKTIAGSESKLGHALTALSRLTRLRLQWEIDNTIKLALGTLTRLQELRLHACGAAAASQRSRLNLPHTLKHLDVNIPQWFNDDSTPDLASLTGLRHLQLQDAKWLNTGMMYGMSQLTHLHLCMACDGLNASCMPPLLDVLSVNQQLRHLQLEVGNADNLQDPMILVGPLEQCGALTSSSHLTSLQLRGLQLPAACGKLLFPEGRVLPDLFTLELPGKPQRWWDNDDHSAYGAPLEPGDIDSLVRSCPGLYKLDVAGSLQPGVDMSGLKHLWRLTSLVVGGESVDDDCAEGLAQVAGLETLIIIDPAKNEENPEDRDPYNDGDLFRASYGSSGRGWSWYGGYYGYGRATEPVGSHFTFEGLYNLMQLRRLHHIGISRNTCLFTGLRLSDAYDCKEMEEFGGWDDPQLQRLLDSNCKWQAFKKRKEREEERAGLQERAAVLAGELAESELQNVAQQHELDDQQHVIADLQQVIVDQQHEIVDLQQEVRRLRQQKRHRQQEQSTKDRFGHKHSRRRQS